MPRRPKKGKSASLLIRNLIKDLNPLELTILRERMLHVCEITKQDITMNPKKYERHIISPDLIVNVMDKCITGLGYEEETKKKNKANITTETIIVNGKTEEVEVEVEIEEERELIEV
jgi:hypothetical protein